MEPFATLRSKAVPLLVDDLDTDVITPIGRVLEGPKAMIEFAFESLRYDAAGRLRPECPLNDPERAGARILIAGANFGCGSSRETAVWAVRGLGFQCVIAPSFGDIFHENCLRNGLLPVRLPAAIVAGLRQALHAAPGSTVTVDLPGQTVTGPDGAAHAFDVDPFRKQALLEGLDDIGFTLRHAAAIDAFEARHVAAWPWAGPAPLVVQDPAADGPRR